MKALVWEDATDATWLSYNDPSWLAERYRLGHGVDGVVNAMTAALAAVAKAAMHLSSTASRQAEPRESDCRKDWQGPYDGLTLVLVGLAAVRFVRTG